MLIIDPVITGDGRLTSHSGRNFMAQAASLLHSYSNAGKELHVLYGNPAAITEALLHEHPIDEVIVHTDYTPYSRQRDEQLGLITRSLGRRWMSIADSPLADLDAFPAFARKMEPYKVFTPFYRKWSSFMLECYSPMSETTIHELATLSEINAKVALSFALPESVSCALGGTNVQGSSKGLSKLERFVRERLASYSESRDAYADDHTSQLARFLNTGAISARQAYEMTQGLPGSESWVRQLAWRDFYLYQAMYHDDFFVTSSSLICPSSQMLI